MELDPTWKAGIEWNLRLFLLFAFPEIHALIDWTISPKPLDAELQKLTPKNERGLLQVGKLFEIVLLSGKIGILFLHIEIQAKADGTFEFRMWTYNYRLCDRYGPNVISLAVLVDDNPKWRPSEYRFELGAASGRSSFQSSNCGIARTRRKYSRRLATRSRCSRRPRKRRGARARIWASEAGSGCGSCVIFMTRA